MGFRYSVVLDTLAITGESVFENPPEVLGAVAEAGFDGVDLGANTPEQRGRLPEIVELAGSLGLKIHSFLGAWAGWHAGEERDLCTPDEAARKHAVGYAKGCVDIAKQIGTPVFEICASPFMPTYPVSPVPVKMLRENFLKSVDELCPYGQKHDITVMIEPINRFEGHPGFMNKLTDAARVAYDSGMPNLAVMGDMFHMNIEDVSICDALRVAGSRLKLIHLADSTREMPGVGHIDFNAVVRTLMDIGFDGSMSLDCVPATPDLKTFLEGSISYMKAMEKANELRIRIGSTE